MDDIKKRYDAQWVSAMRKKSKDELIAIVRGKNEEIAKLKKALKPEQLTIPTDQDLVVVIDPISYVKQEHLKKK